MKKPENTLVRLPILMICGTCLIISGVLVWWDKTAYTPSSTSKPAMRETQLAARQATDLSKNLETPPAYAGFVCSPTSAPALSDLANDVLRRVQELLASGDSADWGPEYTNLLPTLVKISPNAAAHFAESMKSDLLRADTLRTVAQTWASLDSVSAVNWAAQLPDIQERNLELGYVCNEIAVTDPAQAAQLVDRSGLGEHTEAVLQNVAQKWAVQNFSEAKAWATAQPSGKRGDVLWHI